MQRDPRARKNLGDSTERLAALYLQERGYRILAQKVRFRSGELDLVAEDRDGLAFVEVKARRGKRLGAPEEAITPRKQLQLVRLAEEFLAYQPGLADRPWRIDVVAVQLDLKGKVEYIHLIRNAVQL